MKPRSGDPGTPPRIVDVARLAGVSPQTVSNVVNNRGGFTEATRRKVMQAVAQTRYRPNRAARHLRTNRALQIGFSLEGSNLEARNPFTLSLLKAVVDAAKPAGQRVVVFTCERGDVETLEHWALSGEFDGFVFGNVSAGDFRTHLLAGLGVPFAVMGRTSPNEPQSWVDIDNRLGMAKVVDYLVAKGHRDFGYVGSSGAEHWSLERLEGTREKLAERGLHLRPEATILGTYETLGTGIDALLASAQRPTAIITSSDTYALLTINRARTQGLVIGQDVAVTGFDGGLLEWLLDSPLTTVRIPVERIAREVVARVLREIDSGPTEEPGMLLPSELVVGTSA